MDCFLKKFRKHPALSCSSWTDSNFLTLIFSRRCICWEIFYIQKNNIRHSAFCKLVKGFGNGVQNVRRSTKTRKGSLNFSYLTVKKSKHNVAVNPFLFDIDSVGSVVLHRNDLIKILLRWVFVIIFLKLTVNKKYKLTNHSGIGRALIFARCCW